MKRALSGIALAAMVLLPSASAWSGEIGTGKATVSEPRDGLRSRALSIDPLAGHTGFVRRPIIGSLSTGEDGDGTRPLSWRDLLPPVRTPDSAFAHLPAELKEDMRTHVRWVTAPPAKRQEPGFAEAQALARERLEKNGVDVDDLMDRRRKIILQSNRGALEPNEEIPGQTVRIPGYLLPLEIDGTRATSFLLVPTAGACVHTPTPPANQIVHVDFPDGYEITSLFEAVWVVGSLASETTDSLVTYSDGRSNVKANYALAAQKVESFLN